MLLRGLGIGFVSVLAVFAAMYWAVEEFSSEPRQRRYHRGFSFVQPSDWACTVEGTELLCQPESGEARKTAIIVASSKTVGLSDTFEAYEDYLKQPQKVEIPDGANRVSKVMGVDRQNLEGQTWIVGHHFESEIPGYETRYYATVFASTAVLITFSCHQEFCSEFERAGAELAAGMRVTR